MPQPHTDKELRELQTFIEVYPTHQNREPFMLPVGWSSKMSKDVVERVKEIMSLQKQKIIERVKDMFLCNFEVYRENKDITEIEQDIIKEIQ